MRTSLYSAAPLAVLALCFASACNSRVMPIPDDDTVVADDDTNTADDWSNDDETPSNDTPTPPNDDDDPQTDDPPANDPPTNDPPASLDCGFNSFDNGLGSCECDANYSLCDSMDPELGCCAYGADTFRISLVSASVLPYKDATSEKPWDWSGSVPSWLQDLIAEVAVYVDQDAQDWLEVLDYVYEFAPALMSGSTPPDPFVQVEVDGVVTYTSSTVDDDIDASWGETTTVTVGQSGELVLWYMDEDLSLDDTVEGALFTQEDLQWYAGIGAIPFKGSFGAYEFTVAVEPVF